MTKISKKQAYPLKSPIKEDFFIGSDSQNLDKTVNFSFEDATKVINELNGSAVLNYRFETSYNIPLQVLEEGVFLSEANQTTISNITKIHINKKNLDGTDLSQLFQFIGTNKTKFLMRLKGYNNPFNSFYLNIINVTTFADYFTIDVTVSIANAFVTELFHFNNYFIDFELKAGSGGGGETNLDYIASPTNGTVTSDTGLDATIPLADYTNAGLLTSDEKAKIASALQSSDITGKVNKSGIEVDLPILDSVGNSVGSLTHNLEMISVKGNSGVLLDSPTTNISSLVGFTDYIVGIGLGGQLIPVKKESAGSYAPVITYNTPQSIAVNTPTKLGALITTTQSLVSPTLQWSVNFTNTSNQVNIVKLKLGLNNTPTGTYVSYNIPKSTTLVITGASPYSPTINTGTEVSVFLESDHTGRVNSVTIKLDSGVQSYSVDQTIIQGSTNAVSGDAVYTGLSLKSNIASPTFTGTPSAPTATVGTNTTQLATTAFVLANAGSGDMTLGTAQTVTALKTFTNTPSVTGGITINNTNTNTSNGNGQLINSSGFIGLKVTGSGTYGIYTDGTFPIGINGVAVNNTTAIRAYNAGSGSSIGLYSQNTDVGLGIYSRNESSGIGMRLENLNSATGKPFQYLKAGNEKAFINDAGDFSAQSITVLGTLGLRNVANTFTSSFTNTNTAGRTYTLQNRDITFAGTDEIPFKGTFSATGTATTTFTVTIGQTMANTTYVATPVATNTLSAVMFSVQNKTTTTFDIVIVGAGLTGAVAYDFTITP